MKFMMLGFLSYFIILISDLILGLSAFGSRPRLMMLHATSRPVSWSTPL